MLDTAQENLISESLLLLPRPFRDVCLRKDYFITNIPMNSGKKAVYIDTCGKRPDNPEEFAEHSLYLYMLFGRIPKWYNC